MSEMLQFANLASQPNVSHAISTKNFGSMKKEDGTIDHAKVLKFAAHAKIKGIPILMNQIHSANVFVVENNRDIVIPKTDGLITRQKKVALCINTADCLPILFFDPERKVIGAAHAGRKGLAKQIIHEMVKAFTEKFNSNPKDILVSIGPGIERKCYEVGKEVIDELEEAFPDFTKIYSKKNGEYYADLREIAVQSLHKEGILEKHIEVTDMCTYCQTDMVYSYRRGNDNNRFVSMIVLS